VCRDPRVPEEYTLSAEGVSSRLQRMPATVALQTGVGEGYVWVALGLTVRRGTMHVRLGICDCRLVLYVESEGRATPLAIETGDACLDPEIGHVWHRHLQDTLIAELLRLALIRQGSGRCGD